MTELLLEPASPIILEQPEIVVCVDALHLSLVSGLNGRSNDAAILDAITHSTDGAAKIDNIANFVYAHEQLKNTLIAEPNSFDFTSEELRLLGGSLRFFGNGILNAKKVIEGRRLSASRSRRLGDFGAREAVEKNTQIAYDVFRKLGPMARFKVKAGDWPRWDGPRDYASIRSGGMNGN